jgi:hypothetical protein
MSTSIQITELTPATNVGGLYAQTANSTPITATVVETSLIDGGIGTLSVPANGFQVGDSFSVSMGGMISSANNEGLQIKVKSGSVILGTTGGITMPQCTNQVWDLEVIFTIRAIGAAGVASIAVKGQFTYSKDASNAYEGADFSTINNTTFDTTIGNTLSITAQWGSTNAANSIYSQIFVLSKIY